MQPRNRQVPPSRGSASTIVDFEPQIGGQERGGISARPAAENHNLRVHRHKETFIRSRVRAARTAHSAATIANLLLRKQLLSPNR